MLYVSQEDQMKIERRVKRLPIFLQDQRTSIFIFQAVSTFILAYGICISIYKHPIIDKKPDPGCDIFISCFFYFALSISAPFTGGHMNPAVTFAMNWFKENKNIKVYLVAQAVGSLLATILGMIALYIVSIALIFFDTNPAPYTENPYFGEWILDCIAQVGGTFIFVFFIFYVTQTNYSSGEYYGYLIISIMLLMGRTKACLNPIIGFMFQLVYSIHNGYFLGLIWSLAIVAGPIGGGILATIAFTKFYKPLLDETEEQNRADAIKQAEDQINNPV